MPQEKAICHFATIADYRLVLAEISSQRNLKYVVYEGRKAPDFRVYTDPFQAPEFGKNSRPDWLLGMRFLVMPADTELRYEFWPDRAVPEKYLFFGQRGNESSVIFHPSAMYSDGGKNALLWGEVSTTSGHPDSLEIFALFRKILRQRFARTQKCYLGPEATQMMKSGVRLTQALQAPTSTDIAGD